MVQLKINFMGQIKEEQAGRGGGITVHEGVAGSEDPVTPVELDPHPDQDASVSSEKGNTQTYTPRTGN